MVTHEEMVEAFGDDWVMRMPPEVAGRPAESDDAAKAAVARVLAERSYSAQYGRQQVGPQRRQIGEIEGVTDVTTVPPGREQARAAQDSEVAGHLRG